MYQQNSDTFMQNSHEKFQKKNAYAPAKPYGHLPDVLFLNNPILCSL